VVRIGGIDTETGEHRPRQLGTYASKRSAESAARAAIAEGRVGAERGTVGRVVRSWVTPRMRTDLIQKGREQYEWAVLPIEAALGVVPLDLLDCDEVARWPGFNPACDCPRAGT
jgi:hypothetical protein